MLISEDLALHGQVIAFHVGRPYSVPKKLLRCRLAQKNVLTPVKVEVRKARQLFETTVVIILANAEDRYSEQ